MQVKFSFQILLRLMGTPVVNIAADKQMEENYEIFFFGAKLNYTNRHQYEMTQSTVLKSM